MVNFKNEMIELKSKQINIYNQQSSIVCSLDHVHQFNLFGNDQYIFGLTNIIIQVSNLIDSKLMISHNINERISYKYVNKLFEYIIIPPNKIIILLDSKKIYASGIYYNIQLGNCTWMGLEQDQEELFITLKMCGYDW